MASTLPGSGAYEGQPRWVLVARWWVDGQSNSSPDGHILTPGACEYVAFHDTRELAGAIMDVDMGRYSGRSGGLMLLALKMEQRCHEPGNVVASKAGRGKDMDSPLETPERNAALLTP